MVVMKVRYVPSTCDTEGEVILMKVFLAPLENIPTKTESYEVLIEKMD